MATLRYFKATNGQITVFRSTGARAYVSANCEVGKIAFSASLGSGVGWYPAVEIDAQEYAELIAAKVERVRALGKNPQNHTSPQDSWVLNVALTVPAMEGGQ